MKTTTTETKAKNAKKSQRKLADLAAKKDVRGGAGDLPIIKSTDKGSAK